jgi:hypothetical protein
MPQNNTKVLLLSKFGIKESILTSTQKNINQLIEQKFIKSALKIMQQYN